MDGEPTDNVIVTGPQGEEGTTCQAETLER